MQRNDNSGAIAFIHKRELTIPASVWLNFQVVHRAQRLMRQDGLCELLFSDSRQRDVLDLDEFIDAVFGALAADAGFLDAPEGGNLG